METILVEEEVTPRQEDLVPCASLYHYLRLGWRRDLSWSGRAGLCHLQVSEGQRLGWLSSRREVGLGRLPKGGECRMGVVDEWVPLRTAHGDA